MTLDPQSALPTPGLAFPDRDEREPLESGTTLCLLAPLHPERALSLALVQHLADEFPDVDFVLEEGAAVHVLWVCGYERGHADLIRELRRRHPRARMLVTSRDSEDLWATEVLRAGADHALVWPLGYAQLSRVLQPRALSRRA